MGHHDSILKSQDQQISLSLIVTIDVLILLHRYPLQKIKKDTLQNVFSPSCLRSIINRI